MSPQTNLVIIITLFNNKKGIQIKYKYLIIKLSTLALIVIQTHITDKGKCCFLSQTRHANAPHKIQ